MMNGAVPKHQRTIDEMMGAAGPVTKELGVGEEGQGMETVDVAKLVASLELSPQMVEEMRKVPEAVYHICTFGNVDFRKIVNDHELMSGGYLLGSVNLVLSGPSYNV